MFIAVAVCAAAVSSCGDDNDPGGSGSQSGADHSNTSSSSEDPTSGTNGEPTTGATEPGSADSSGSSGSGGSTSTGGGSTGGDTTGEVSSTTGDTTLKLPPPPDCSDKAGVLFRVFVSDNSFAGDLSIGDLPMGKQGTAKADYWCDQELSGSFALLLPSPPNLGGKVTQDEWYHTTVWSAHDPGLLIADSLATFTVNDIHNHPQTLKGGEVVTDSVWTGTKTSCQGWSSLTDLGSVGNPFLKDKLFQSESVGSCDSLNRLYCVCRTQ